MLVLIFAGCESQILVNYHNVRYVYNYDDYEEVVSYKENEEYDLITPSRIGFRFVGWYIDEELSIPFSEENEISDVLVLYAKWQEKILVKFVDDANVKIVEVNKGEKVEPLVISKENYILKGWTNTDGQYFDFNTPIIEETILYADWALDSIHITYNTGLDFYNSKDELCEAFYTDFYQFLISKNYNFDKLNITSASEFITFCKDWNAQGKSDLYGVGDAFSSYYVKIDVGGTIENQGSDTFIGYCYENGKYRDFIPHLITFFAYWRTDEGYTGGSSDPNNTGNDFFASPWASLVDTAKFFFFTSKTLNSKYSWFNSVRVKDALDNIPSVISLPNDHFKTDPIVLPQLSSTGYNFLGWYDGEGNDANRINIVYSSCSVYAKWEKIDNE